MTAAWPRPSGSALAEAALLLACVAAVMSGAATILEGWTAQDAYAQQPGLDVTGVGKLQATDILSGANDVAVIGIGGDPHAVVTYYTGVAIIDISNPADPDNVGGLDSLDFYPESPDTQGLLERAFGVDVFETGGGTYAAVTSTGGRQGVLIINITDPSGPALVGNLTDADAPLLNGPSRVDTFKMGTKTYAAVASNGDNGLQLVDVTDPADPDPAGGLRNAAGLLLGRASDVAVFTTGTKTYAAVTSARDGGLQLVNVTDPDDPVPAGKLADDGLLLLGSPRGVDIFTTGSRTYAAVASGLDDGLQLVDVTDPDIPVAAGSISDTDHDDLLLDGAFGVDIFETGTKTYAAVASRFDGGLQLVDVTDPADPDPAGSVPDTAGEAGLLLDLPLGLDTFKLNGDTYALVASARDDGLQLVDISDPDMPAAAGKLKDMDDLLLGSPRGVDTFMINNSVFAAVASARDGGLQLVKILDADSIHHAGNLPDDPLRQIDTSYAVDTFMIGNRTYAVAVSDAYDGLQLVDVTNPDRIVAAGALPDTDATLIDNPRDVDTFKIGSDTYAAVASSSTHDDGLSIVDVTVPESPHEIGHLRDTSGDGNLLLSDARSVAVFTTGSKTYAAVATFKENGIQTIDISVPSDPTGVGQLHYPPSSAEPQRSFFAIDTFETGSKTYAAATTFESGLTIIDISEPDTPTEVGHLADDRFLLLEDARDVEIFTKDGRIYAAIASLAGAGLQTVDITNPADPREAGQVRYEHGANPLIAADHRDLDIFTIGDKTYAAVASGSDHRLRLIDLTDPARPIEVGHLVDGEYLLLEHTRGVDTFVIGGDVYAVIVSAAESGIQVLRLTAEATARPVITVLGDNPATHELGDAYVDAGAEAIYADPANTDPVMTTSNVNILKSGDYAVGYTATDEHGSTGTATRTVQVRDTTKPVITLNGTDPLTVPLSVTYADPGATVTDNDPAYNGTATPSDTVDTGMAGNHTVTYTAPADDGGNVPDPVTRTVEVRDTPPTAGPVAIQVAAGQYVDYSPVARGDASDLQTPEKELVISIPDTNPAEKGTAVVLEDSQTIRYAANPDAAGTDDFDYDVTDAAGLTAAATVTVTITDNPAPQPDGSLVFTVREGHLLNQTIAITDDTVPDDGLTFALNGSQPQGLTVTKKSGSDTDALIMWQAPDEVDVESYPFGLSISDGVTDVTETVTVNIEEANVNPVFDAVPEQNAVAGVQFELDLEATDADLPAQTLTYSITGNVSPDAEIDESTGVITWTPNAAGGQTITVQVSDDFAPEPGTDELDIAIDVGANGSPQVTSDLEFAVAEGATLSEDITITDTHPPDGGLIFTPGAGAPPGLTASLAQDSLTNAVLAWTAPEEVPVDSYEFDLQISDGVNAAVTETVMIEITEVNRDPEFDMIARTHTIPLEDMLELSLHATDTDLPAQILTYGISGQPTPPASIGPGNILTWDPETLGSHTITVTVTDDYDPPGSDSAEISVQVVDILKPMITLNGAQSVTVELGGTYAEQGAEVTDNDPDYAGEATPEGDVDTGTVGVYTVTYTAPADDAGNEADEVTRTVMVQDTAVPDPPKPPRGPSPEPRPPGPSGGGGTSEHNRGVNRDPLVYIRSVAWDCAAETVTIAAGPVYDSMEATVFTLMLPQHQTESYAMVGDAAVFTAPMHPEETYIAAQVSAETGGHVSAAAELINVDSCTGGLAFAGDDIILLPEPGAGRPADPPAAEPPSPLQAPPDEEVPEPDADAAGPEPAGSRAPAAEPPSQLRAPPETEAVPEPEPAGSRAAGQTGQEESLEPCGEEGTLLADYMCGTAGGSGDRIGAQDVPAEPVPARCDLWCRLLSLFAWL